MSNMYEPQAMGLPAEPSTALSTQASNARDPASRLLDVTVMMIDDEPMMTAVTQAYLEDVGYRRFVAVNDPRVALRYALKERPGLILLDLVMPGVSGFELLQRFRARPELRYTPIIVLSASADAASKLRALELGATEFLSKPVDASELTIRVRNSLAFKVYQDRLANDDPLTGLPNRRSFVRRLEASLLKSAQAQLQSALLLINLDRFRQINETLGHAAGDELLAAVALRLRECTRVPASALGALGNRADEGAMLARVGGDEFAVLLPAVENAEPASRVARQVLSALARPVEVNGRPVVVTPSIGLALAPGDGHDAAGLLSNAGLAMRHAKDSGRNGFQFYSAELNSASLEALTLETQLRGAIQRQELELHYQPKVNLASGRIVGAEALLRWRHPELGMVPPMRFIPMAEEAGLIIEISNWVLETACTQMAAWRQELGLDVKVAVNVSRHGLVSGALAASVAQAISRHGLVKGQLVLELTESMLMDRVETTAAKLRELRELGAGLSIDDFGTGYSSMSYLKQFPVQELKIDRSFVMGTPNDEADSAIVRALIALAHSLKMRVVAEGVEQAAQRDALREWGCDEFQGYLCSPAVQAPAFAVLIKASLAEPEPD